MRLFPQNWTPKPKPVVVPRSAAKKGALKKIARDAVIAAGEPIEYIVLVKLMQATDDTLTKAEALELLREQDAAWHPDGEPSYWEEVVEVVPR